MSFTTRALPLAAFCSALFLAPASSWGQVPQAAPAPAGVTVTQTPVSASYVARLAEVVDAFHMTEFMRSVVKAHKQGGLMQQQVIDEMLRRITPVDYARELAPAFVARMPEADLAVVVRLLRQPGPQRFVETMARNPSELAKVRDDMSAEQKAQLQAIEYSPQFNQFNTILKGVDQQAIGRRLGEARSAELGRELLAVLREGLQQAGEKANAGRKVPLKTLGVPAFDELARVVVDSQQEMAAGYRAFDEMAEKSGFVTAMQPSELASPTGRAKGRVALDRMDVALEEMLKRADASVTSRRERMAGYFTADDGMGKLFDANLGSAYEFTVRYGEANRNVLEAARRLLAYLDAHAGAVTLSKAGKLQMKTEAEHEALLTLLENMSATGDELDALVKSQSDKEQKFLNSGVPPVGPASATK